MAANARRQAQEDARAIVASRRFQATVVAVSGGRIQIQRLGQATPDARYYPAREGLAATVSPGDPVVCDVIGGAVIVDYKYVTS